MGKSLKSVRLFGIMLNVIKHERISKQISVPHDKTDVLAETCTKLFQVIVINH